MTKGTEIHSQNYYLLLLLVFSPWASLGRNQSPVRRPVWLWYAASWASFLAVVCHRFPPRLDVPTRFLHVRNYARYPSSERWNYGRERLSGNFAYMASLFAPLWIFYMPQIYDMGPTALLPLRRKACCGFFFSLRPGLNPRT